MKRTILAVLALASVGTVRGQVGPEIKIEQPAGTNLTDGGSVLFGLVPVGTSVTKTFTISNTGQGLLTGLALSKLGTNQSDFSTSGPVWSYLYFQESTTFSVTFTPSQAGGKTAIVRVSSNDFNENPFDINMTGIGTIPEIEVLQGGASLGDGVSTVNFGKVNAGTTATRPFTIRNAGTGTLTDLAFSISGSAFSLGTLPATTTLGSGGTMTVNVKFSPQDSSSSSGTLRIFSSDADENPFDIALTGTGNIPWLEVEQPEGTALVSGFSTFDFGSAAIGESVPLAFTIRNVGTFPLTGLAIVKSGDNAADFLPEVPSATTLQPGETAAFTVRFSPSAAGERTAIIAVSGNETLSTPFVLNLKGTSTGLSDAGDADGDGTPNLVESATGSDPLVPGPPPGSLVKKGDLLEFTCTRLKASFSTVAFTLEWSDSLQGVWSSIGEAGLTLVREDDVTQQVKYTLPAGTGQRFVRLRVTRL